MFNFFMNKIFRDLEANHEIHKNIVPQKFGVIRYSSTRDDILSLLSRGNHMPSVGEQTGIPVGRA